MNGLLDIIFFAVVAVFILVRLKNVLGQKTDEDDKRRQERYRKHQTVKDSSAKVIEFPGKQKAPIPEPFEELKVVSPNIATGLDAKVMEVVASVTAVDKGFTLAWFMMGAKKAFEMILEAFSKGDEKMLGNLLSKEIFQEFQSDLKAQADAKRKRDITLVSILDCSVVDASVQNGIASFTVKFISEQIRVTRDLETEKIVEGNASQIDRVEDVWMFNRPIRSSSPNWQLVAVDT